MDAQMAIVSHLPFHGHRLRARIAETNGADPNWHNTQCPALTHRDDHTGTPPNTQHPPPVPMGVMPTRDGPRWPQAGREEHDNCTGVTSIPSLSSQWVRRPLATHPNGHCDTHWQRRA
jgi:hypothetical protein